MSRRTMAFAAPPSPAAPCCARDPGPAAYLPLNRMVVTGPRPPTPMTATWKRYFLPFVTLALNTRLLVVFHALYFFPPGLEIRTRYEVAAGTAFQVILTVPFLITALTPVTLPGAAGGTGAAKGVTGTDGADGADVPMALRAVTVKL
jgi:hypothetical protein